MKIHAHVVTYNNKNDNYKAYTIADKTESHYVYLPLSLAKDIPPQSILTVRENKQGLLIITEIETPSTKEKSFPNINGIPALTNLFGQVFSGLCSYYAGNPNKKVEEIRAESFKMTLEISHKLSNIEKSRK